MSSAMWRALEAPAKDGNETAKHFRAMLKAVHSHETREHMADAMLHALVDHLDHEDGCELGDLARDAWDYLALEGLGRLEAFVNHPSNQP